jgi:hypothetical protein
MSQANQLECWISDAERPSISSPRWPGTRTSPIQVWIKINVRSLRREQLSGELYEGFGEKFQGHEFDLVISLSVVEHVKRLDRFLAVSVQAAREGGRVGHRYHLGHALSPSSLGERLRVAAATKSADRRSEVPLYDAPGPQGNRVAAVGVGCQRDHNYAVPDAIAQGSNESPRTPAQR